MAEQIGTKGAFFSLGIWGSLAALLVPISQLYDYLNALPVGTLPPKVQAILVTLGSLLAIYRRITATKQIQGVV